MNVTIYFTINGETEKEAIEETLYQADRLLQNEIFDSYDEQIDEIYDLSTSEGQHKLRAIEDEQAMLFNNKLQEIIDGLQDKTIGQVMGDPWGIMHKLAMFNVYEGPDCILRNEVGDPIDRYNWRDTYLIGVSFHW
jgi:hypothetical protein